MNRSKINIYDEKYLYMVNKIYKNYYKDNVINKLVIRKFISINFCIIIFVTIHEIEELRKKNYDNLYVIDYMVSAKDGGSI